jgi:hypothetical protein
VEEGKGHSRASLARDRGKCTLCGHQTGSPTSRDAADILAKRWETGSEEISERAAEVGDRDEEAGIRPESTGRAGQPVPGHHWGGV